MFHRCVPALKAAAAATGRPALSSTIPKAQPQCLRGLATVAPTAREGRSDKIMLEDENGYGFIRHNNRPPKPRTQGVTEIRGPYYSAMGKRYLQDVLET